MASLSFPPDYRIVKIGTFAVTVTGSAIQVDTAANIAGMEAFMWVTLYNNSSVVLYYGGDNTVTTSTGFPLAAGEAITLPATDASTFNVWVIAVSGSNDLRVLLAK